jgi:hypothetical protein
VSTDWSAASSPELGIGFVSQSGLRGACALMGGQLAVVMDSRRRFSRQVQGRTKRVGSRGNFCWKVVIALLGLSICAMGQDPYSVAGDHYHLVFENLWVRATRVTYAPGETAPVHQHPPTPTTVYVYVTDGGVMRFRHITGERVAGVSIERKAVQAGAIRFAHGAPETHAVEYLGDIPTEYARIELRTEPLDRPVRDVRLPPVVSDLSKSSVAVQFENGQVRILRVVCGAGQRCPDSEHADDPAVVVIMSGPHRGEVLWSSAPREGPLEEVRIELKSKPVGQARLVIRP